MPRQVEVVQELHAGPLVIRLEGDVVVIDDCRFSVAALKTFTACDGQAYRFFKNERHELCCTHLPEFDHIKYEATPPTRCDNPECGYSGRHERWTECPRCGGRMH